MLATQRFLVSPLFQSLGLQHGFSTRCGGVSPTPWDSLNTSSSVGDSPENVAHNIALLAQDAGFSPAQLCQLHQVHGNQVLVVEKPETSRPEADAMITDQPLVLGIRTADCVPILMADGKGRVAAIHAGWRGTLANIAGKALAVLRERGSASVHLHIAIGPAIGPCCFEVSADIAQPFAGISEKLVRQVDETHYKVDLWQANRILLEQEGIPPSHIEILPLCTFCHPNLFFSHRRDQGKMGHQMAFIRGGL